MTVIYRLLMSLMFVLLVSCKSNSVGDIASLGYEHSIKPITKKTRREKPRDVVQYSRFVNLFESVANQRMRREGVRQLAKLQLRANKRQGNNKGLIELQSVIELFEKLVVKYPDKRNDQLLYQLSKVYEENAQPDAALVTLDRLVKDYPNTRRLDEAQFRRGEILFVKRRYGQSEKAYHAVVKHGEASSFYEQAVYKRGWAQFKQSQYDAAVDSFMHLLDRNVKKDRLDLQAMGRSRREFVEDALRAISLSFSYQAGAISADQYLSKRKKRVYESTLFLNLAGFYVDKKHYADAVKAYRTFVKRNPDHSQAPAFLINVIAVYEQGGFEDLYIAAKKDFVQRYGMKSAFWSRQGSGGLQIVVKKINQNLLDLARYYHALAQKQHRKNDYREAQRWYRAFLSSFPDDPQAADINFLFAEILFEDKQFTDAVLQYERTAYDYRDYKKSSDAGYAALLTYDKHEAQLKGRAKQEWHRRSIDSGLRFVNAFPQHRMVSKVRLKAAENLYGLGEYPDAYALAKQYTKQQQTAKDAGKNNRLLAAYLVVMAHIEFEWTEYKLAEASYKKAMKLMPSNSSQRKQLADKQAVAVYKQGEISRQKGELKQAVKHFSRVKQFQAAGGIIANAEYDAAASLIALRDWGKAAAVLESFRRTHPKHKLRNDVTKKLALVYAENGNDKKAAVEYERISKFKGPADYQMQALWQSAELYEQVNATKKAVKIYKQFVKRFSTSLEHAVDARQRLVEIYHRQTKAKEAMHWRRQIIKAERAAKSKATERMRLLAAQASFALAEVDFEAYKKIQLSVPLKRSLKKKKKQMQKTLKAYGRVSAYKVADMVTASTFRVAEIYQDLGLAIYNSERPPGLNDEQMEQYDILLEEQAYPFEEKAIELHEVNVKRIPDGIYGVWVKKSLEQLKELLPVRYVRNERNDEIIESIF